MRKHIQWSVQDAIELQAAVIIAAGAACAGSARDTKIFLNNMALALSRHASAAGSPHVTEALRGISDVLREVVPPVALYCESATSPFRRGNLSS